jgi:hypothetical protein
VLEDPTALARGKDPQLERAIQEVMLKLKDAKPVVPPPPAKENRQ